MNHLLYSVHELEKAMGAKSVIQRTEATVRTLLTDSRKLHDTAFGLLLVLPEVMEKRLLKNGYFNCFRQTIILYAVQKAIIRNWVWLLPFGK